MQSDVGTARTVVVLGTGGTIAGTAARADDGVGYRAAQLGVERLVAGVPALAAAALECEQVAQIDSKDLDVAVWRSLVRACARHLARTEVRGLVVTHGSDTLEETALLLQRVLAPAKPIALAAAMRPATALLADGPQNLLDAVTVARTPGAQGVVVVVGGRVWPAVGVRKRHTWRLDAFDAGDAGPVAAIEDGRLRRFRAWPQGAALGAGIVEREPWPRVEIVLNHAGADGHVVRALRTQGGLDGLVVAGTGNGTASAALEAALAEAEAGGVVVRRSTRCAAGPVLAPDGVGDDLGAPQARVDLLLELLAARR